MSTTTDNRSQAEHLRLTQFVTDATENALNEAMKLAGEGSTSEAGVMFYCARALCFELAGLRAQTALLRNEVAEISAELSDIKSAMPQSGLAETVAIWGTDDAK